MGLIVYGFLSAIGIVTTLAKISPTFLKRVLGYDWVVDILLGFAIIFGFGMTGTISGMMIGVVSDLAVSLVLWVTRKTWKYQIYEKGSDGKRQWVEYNGEWTIAYLVSKLKSSNGGFKSIVAQVKTAWNAEEAVA